MIASMSFSPLATSVFQSLTSESLKLRLRRLGVAPQHCVFVGDRYDHDAAGRDRSWDARDLAEPRRSRQRDA